VYHNLKKVISKKYGQDACNVGDEGGFAPNVSAAAAVIAAAAAIAAAIAAAAATRLASRRSSCATYPPRSPPVDALAHRLPHADP